MISKVMSSSLFKLAGVYTLSNIVNSAVPFLLIPVYTRYLLPNDYGIIAMFQVMTGVIVPFIGLSVHGAIGRHYIDKSKEDLAEYIANCIILMIASCSLVAVIFVIFGSFVANLSSLKYSWLWTIWIFAFCQIIVQIVLVLWQMQNKAKQYALFSLIQTVANAGLSLYTIVELGMGWKGRLGSQVSVSVLFALFALFILFRQNWLIFKFNKAYMLNALSFGLPLIPHALSGWATEMIDRVFVTNIVGVADTGVYSVGYQIGMTIGILESSFIQAWVPHLYRQLKENTPSVKLKLVKFTYAYCIGLFALAIILGVIAKYIMPYLVGSKFLVAEKYIFWIALGYAFCGMYKMMAGYFFFFEKTNILAKITTLSAIINIILTYLLVSRYKTIGAAYATSLSYFILFIMVWYFVDKIIKMPWLLNNRRVLSEQSN